MQLAFFSLTTSLLLLTTRFCYWQHVGINRIVFAFLSHISCQLGKHSFQKLFWIIYLDLYDRPALKSVPALRKPEEEAHPTNWTEGCKLSEFPFQIGKGFEKKFSRIIRSNVAEWKVKQKCNVKILFWNKTQPKIFFCKEVFLKYFIHPNKLKLHPNLF